MLIVKVMKFGVGWYIPFEMIAKLVKDTLHIIGKSVQVKVELLMDLVHPGLESAVFVSKTIA